MKLKSILIILLAIPVLVFAQEPGKQNHFIEVTGTALLEVVPNEIYISVRLREFEENKQKVLLEKIDKDFLTALDAAGINRNQLELADAGLQLGRLRRKQKDVFREKTYQLKLTSAAQVEKFIDKIEAVKVENMDVVRLHHSDLEKLRLELKVKALQAAKTKAETLLKSIGAEIGKPIVIREIDFEPSVDNSRFMLSNTSFSYRPNNSDADSDQVWTLKKSNFRRRLTPSLRSNNIMYRNVCFDYAQHDVPAPY